MMLAAILLLVITVVAGIALAGRGSDAPWLDWPREEQE